MFDHYFQNINEYVSLKKQNSFCKRTSWFLTEVSNK